MEFTVPDEAGSDYDVYARLLAPELERRLQTQVQVVNVPGADGMIALNRHQKGPQGEPRLILVNAVTALAAQVGDRPGLAYDLWDWPWLATISEEPWVIVTAPDGAYTDWGQVARSRDPVRFATSHRYGVDYLFAVLLDQGLETPLRLVNHDDTAGVLNAVRRGEAELGAAPTRVAMRSIVDGHLRPLTLLAHSDRWDEQPPAGILTAHRPRQLLTLPEPWVEELRAGEYTADPPWKVIAELKEATDVGIYVAGAPGTSFSCRALLFETLRHITNQAMVSAISRHCLDGSPCENAIADTGDRYRGLLPLEPPDGRSLYEIYNDFVAGPEESIFKDIYTEPETTPPSRQQTSSPSPEQTSSPSPEQTSSPSPEQTSSPSPQQTRSSSPSLGGTPSPSR